MSNIEIRKVTTKRDLKKFVTFPWKIYKGDKNWVPPIISEKIKLLDKEKSPFFDHGDAELFMAYKDGKFSGTIAAIRDDNFIKHSKTNSGYFGFFESINDEDVSEALFKTAEDWNRKQGLTDMIGPMNPSTNDECGLLIEGFDSPPVLMMTYNPKYYIKLYENFGLTKYKDLFALLAKLDFDIPPKLERVAKKIKERNKIETRGVDLKNFKRELGYIKEVYNNAWSDNWGFVPMTDREMDMVADGLKDLVKPELVRFAFVDGKPVAFILIVPDYNEVFIKMNGRLSPLGILTFLLNRNKIKKARVILLGIREGYRKQGIDSVLFYESFQASKKYKYEYVEFSWVLEENVLIHRTAEKVFGAKKYKTYRIYGKKL